MVRQKMRGRHRNTRAEENLELQQSRDAPIAVAEGMDPGQVQVGQGRQHEDPGVAQHVVAPAQVLQLAIEPVAQPADQVVAVLRRRPPVTADDDVMSAELAGDHALLLGLADHEAGVLLLEALGAQRRGMALQAVAGDVIEQVHDVLDLLLLVGPRRRDPGLALHNGPHILLTQAVALDAGGPVRAPLQADLIELLGELRGHGRAGQVLALRGRLPQQSPGCGTQPVHLETQRDPRMSTEIPPVAVDLHDYDPDFCPCGCPPVATGAPFLVTAVQPVTGPGRTGAPGPRPAPRRRPPPPRCSSPRAPPPLSRS